MSGLFSVIILLLSATTAFAAPTQIAFSPDRVAGLIAGVVLLATFSYAFAIVTGPALRSATTLWALAALLLILVIKLLVLPFLPGLGIDVGTYQAWAIRMAEVGPARMYEPGYFVDYPPGYMYLLWAAGSFVHGLAASGTAARVIVETPPLIGDLLLGLMLFCAMRRSARPSLAWVALFMFALNPALLFDTVAWGQSDSILALLLLLSVLLMFEDEFWLSWAIMAMAVLVKPQALILVPILALATFVMASPSQSLESALAFLAAAMIGILPFQIGHNPTWIFSLYTSTAAYYHETSVNAFNLMALISGLRQQDTTPIFGIRALYFGTAMTAMFYGWISWLVWRRRDADTILMACFAVLFGVFMLAPRMHERYLYPALVFAIPLALDSPIILGILGVLTLTFLANLVYVKHALEAGVFFDAHDPYAMAVAVLNVVALAATCFQLQLAPSAEKLRRWLAVRKQALADASVRDIADSTNEVHADFVPRWLRADTISISLLTFAAAFTRFWHIGFPGEIVFDEVHFVGQARHYLHSEPFLDPHPPIAKLLIALGILIFGDHPWSWRIGNAIVGTALIPLTYLLGRRMFGSRLAALLAAAFVLCDGMFLVDSRVAVLDIVYLTFAALAYLFLFMFMQSPIEKRRRLLIPIGIALGLCLASKLYIPVVTCLLVAGFMIYAIVKSPSLQHQTSTRIEQRIAGALAVVGGIVGFIYVASFVPHFALGWWGGIEDLFNYYKQVVWYEQSVSSASHPYSAPWWSWPFLLRPIAYWQNFPTKGNTVATIWGGGNPILWWGALTGVFIAAVQAIDRKSLSRAFLAIGYAGYLAIWIPIGRTLFLYHYMPAVYLGFLALAAALTDCWEGRAQLLEQIAILITLFPVALLGFGIGVGVFLCLGLVAFYIAFLGNNQHSGRFVFVSFVAAAAILFIYYFPIWTGMPIQRAGYYARMWFQGPGIRNWI